MKNKIKFIIRRLFKKGVHMDEKEINNRINERKYYTPLEIEEFLKEIGDNFKIIKNNKKVGFYNIPCSFDIETTSFYTKNNMKGDKVAITYEWTLGINWIVMIGRTWEEFIKVATQVAEHFQTNKDRRLVLYVHNLGFEFQSFRKLFSWEKVFSLEKRKPIQALSELGLEFRCSYLLSGYSLKNLAGQLHKYKVQKMVGDLDYSLIRHSETPLTEKEIGYCLCDVYVVMAYIQEEIERLGDITKIPLTKTGYVRRHCRDSCLYEDKSHRTGIMKYKNYRKLMEELSLTANEYKLLKRAFQGGFTHANPYFSRGVFKNVASYDFTSSYPAVMIAEKFPMSKGELVKINSIAEFNENIKCYCCVFDIRITNLTPKILYENPISVSRCRKLKNPIENNGRLVSADSLETTMTEQDFYIANHFYDWECIEVTNFIRYRKGYLPTNFIKAILDLYVNKTTLKGVKGRELDYNLSKEQLNSCYGMCVTDICRDEITYDGGWDSEPANIEDVIDKYNKSSKRFLSYAWGVWVTAYARYNLFTGIVEFNNDYIYSDTDSLKVVNHEKHQQYFEDYNQTLKAKLKKAMDYHKFSMDMVEPKTINGVKKLIGVWDFEGVYDRFKTLGAKRYMTETNGEISITVSGLNKTVAVPYLKEKYGENIFNAFDDSLYIPPQYTGKMTHTYIDEESYGIVTDYLGNKFAYAEMSGTHLEPCDYSLDITEKYIDYILGIQESEE